MDVDAEEEVFGGVVEGCFGVGVGEGEAGKGLGHVYWIGIERDSIDLLYILFYGQRVNHHSQLLLDETTQDNKTRHRHRDKLSIMNDPYNKNKEENVKKKGSRVIDKEDTMNYLQNTWQSKGELLQQRHNPYGTKYKNNSSTRRHKIVCVDLSESYDILKRKTIDNVEVASNVQKKNKVLTYCSTNTKNIKVQQEKMLEMTTYQQGLNHPRRKKLVHQGENLVKDKVWMSFFKCLRNQR